MDKFYPKNFVMWRPHLLLLLIFLEAIYDSTGLNKGVAASYTNGEHKSFCTEDIQCKEGLECDKLRNECVCRNIFKNRPRISSKHSVFYDRKSGTCVSPVGKVCTIKDDGLWNIPCVPYAFCAAQRGKQLADVFGLCQCNPEFEETEDHLCKPAMVIQIADDKPIFTMAHRVGLPTEENMSGSSVNKNDEGKSSEDGKPVVEPQDPMSSGIPSIRSDTEDDNTNIEVYQHVVDNWKKTNLPTSGVAQNSSQSLLYSLFVKSFLILLLLLLP